MTLADTDRELIARAREVGPALRASNGDRDRLAGWLLAGLADLAERLAGDGQPQTCQACGHIIDGRSPHPPECADCPEGYCEARP